MNEEKIIKLSLPLPPSFNDYFREWDAYKRRWLITAAGRRYKRDVKFICQQEGIEPFTGTVRATLYCYLSSKWADLDNVVKPTFDALTGYGYEDDRQIVQFHSYKRLDLENPRIEIQLRELMKQGRLI